MVYATQKLAKNNQLLAATFGGLAGAIMGVAIAYQMLKEGAKMDIYTFMTAAVLGAIIGAAFNLMLQAMMTPPEIDYSQYETTALADLGRPARMYDTGGLGSRHEMAMVEPGESIVSKTANMAVGGNKGITINISGDVYDGDNFAEKVGTALPNALRNVDDVGGL